MQSQPIRKAMHVAAAVFLLAFAVACGGGKSSTGNGTSTQLNLQQTSTTTGSVSAFLVSTGSDQAAAVKADVTAVALTDASNNSAALIGSTQRVEFRHLDDAETLLAQATVNTASYTNVNITLANPELQVADGVGGVTQVTASTTPKVTLGHTTVTVPVAISVPSNGVAAFVLTLNLQNSITIDANGNYVFDPVITATAVSGTNTASLRDVTAKITGVASGTAFDAQVVGPEKVIRVTVDGNTQYGASIANFANLKAGQYVELDARFQADGTYLAQFVNAAPPDLSLSSKGVVSRATQDASGNVSVAVIVQN